MLVRRLSRADAPAIRDIYMAAVAAGVWDDWPGGVNRDQTLAHVRRLIASGGLALGYFKPEDTLRAFFFARREQILVTDTTPPLPEDYRCREKTWKLVLWERQRGLPLQAIQQALNEIRDYVCSRAAGFIVWGEVPHALKMKGYLDAAGFTQYAYDRQGVQWHFWVWEVGA